MKYGLTTGLMISSFVFILCLVFFGIGCHIILNGTVQKIWIWIVVFSFLISIPALVYLVKCKNELNRYIDFGKPVYLATGKVKEIIAQVNQYGIEQLKDIIERAMKDQIIKTVKKEKKT